MHKLDASSRRPNCLVLVSDPCKAVIIRETKYGRTGNNGLGKTRSGYSRAYSALFMQAPFDGSVPSENAQVLGLGR